MTTSSHQHNTYCLDLFKKLSEYIDQELDVETCRQIEQHVKKCPPCHACLETLKTTAGLCHRMKEAPMPSALSDRLKNMIRDLTV